MSALTTIDFNGAKLIAIPGDRPETTLVAMKPIVEGIGLDWSSQLKKIKSNPVLSKGMVEITIPSAGGEQVMQALPLNRIHGWLMTIHPGKISNLTVRARVVKTQTEAADVLFNHFFGKAIASGAHLTARETGGITKAVVNKAIAPVVARVEALAVQLQQITASYDPSAGFSADFRPMLAYIEKMGVPPKARRALVSAASRRCRMWLFHRGRYDMVRPSRETGRHLFHVSAVPDWMQAEGNRMVRDHMDRLIGQTSIPLPKPVRHKENVRPFARTPEAVS